MKLSAVQPFTALDYPGKLACIVFTVGCNFRCGYCHNPEFILPEKIRKLGDSFIPESIFFNFLEQRKGLLDAVVICGGEPTQHADLKEFIFKIKSMGFLVKLDTNGSRSDLLRELIEEKLVDYIAMDFKADLKSYPFLVGKAFCATDLLESLSLIESSGLEYEIRTTLIKELHKQEVLDLMRQTLLNTKRLRLQRFRPAHCLDPSFQAYTSFTAKEEKNIRDFFLQRIPEVLC